MKQSYYRRRSAFFSSPGRVAAVLAAFVALVLILLRFVAPSAFFALASPLFNIGNSISGSVKSDETAKVQADRALMNENIALSEQLREVMKLVGDESARRTGIVAGVVARPPLAPYDTLLIGKGQADGVSAGMLVSAEGGVPIGIVDMAAEHHAQVSLFSSAGRESDGWAGEDKLPVTLTGEGGGAFITKVPRDADIPVGAFAYLPGPGSRPVGRVERVDADPSSPSATLRIAPLANIFSITVVLIENPS